MATLIADNFQVYYAEKLWELIPEIYRHEDGLAQPPGVLRAIVEILAEQAATLRRSQDHLWEDQFIEWCREWAVPYLGDLVGTRLVSALNLRGRRVDVAKTIYYRRRKGTLRVLEELISDIAGWEGKAVEQFRRLGRNRHGLDPEPLPYAGPYSGTLPGGWADLRRPLAARFAGSAWDDYFYTPDARRHRGSEGRKNIPKLALHLFRLPARKVAAVEPHPWTDKTFGFDPSGRDIALFILRQRSQDASNNWDDWQSAQPWELPAPMSRRVLGHAEYQIEESLIVELEAIGLAVTAAADLRTLRGQRFKNEARLHLTLSTLPHSAALLAPAVWQGILRGAVAGDCSQPHLIPAAVKVEEIPQGAAAWQTVPADQIASGNLSDWSAQTSLKRCILDPELGRLKFLGDAPQKVRVSYHDAFPGYLGAGTYERQAYLETATLPEITSGGAIPANVFADQSVVQIGDSLNYQPAHHPAPFNRLAVQAADGQRPYLKFPGGWMLEADGAEAELTLEGLWLGSPGNRALILRGDFKRVTIRHCTFDPGGRKSGGQLIPHFSLAVEGHVDELTIDSSVMGPIYTVAAGVVEKLRIRDSVLQSGNAAQNALTLNLGRAEINRTTILGKTRVHRLQASELLAAGGVEVVDTQNGCCRFSAALRGSRLPHPYEFHFLEERELGAIFTSTRFGHWGYAQVAQTAPAYVQTGAENGSELGAYCSCLNPIKLKSLQAKVEEYLPFGLIPIYIPEV